MPAALILGVALAVACLAYVLYPVLRSNGRSRGESAATHAAPGDDTPREVTDDEIEAAVSAYRATHFAAGACRSCGPRPESDPLFCSSCGRPLNPSEGAAPG